MTKPPQAPPNGPRLDLNPSSAERWTTCTASPHFILENWDKLPPSGNKFSEEGTTAHEVAAATLEGREPNMSECPTEITPEMRWHAFEYSEYVNGLREHPSTLIVEKKYPLWYMPERNAKIDVAILNPKNTHIVDLKYGEGIVVSPEENLQAAIYARSVIRGSVPDDHPFFIHIYQPRGRDIAQPHHVWETTWEEIVAFTWDRVEKPARTVLHNHSSKAVFAPSDKACQWCPAKGFCSARQEFLTRDLEDLSHFSIVPFDPASPLDNAAQALWDGVLADPAPEVVKRKDELVKLNSRPKAGTPLPLANTLSEDQLIAIQKSGSDIKKWIDDVLEYNTERGTAGHVLPGFKMVLSRGGNRYWTDQKAVIDGLLKDTVLKRSEIVEEKIIGPAAVEKLLGKGKLPASVINYIDKPPGSPVIAPVDDKRESCLLDGASEFEALPE